MKHAVRHFEEQTGISEGTSTVLMARHFFNARGVELEKSFLGIMRSLLCQILSHARPLLERFIPAFHRKQSTHGSNWEWHAEELRAFMLSTLASQLPPTYLCIDALDECEESERQDVVAFIEALMDHARSSDILLRVIFSSRHFPDINIEACEEIHPEKHNSTDISIYVEQRLSNLPDTKGALILGEEIVRKAQGIFLWVVLVTDILLAQKNEPVKVMRDKLIEIPPGLIQLYDSFLEGLSHKERENMLHIIQWVLFAERPLTPEELLTAMAFDDEIKYPSFKAWRESGMLIEDQTQIEGLIRDRSRGMIEVIWDAFDDNPAWSSETEERTGTVQFIHESARGFFLHDNEDALAILAPALREKFVGSSHDRLARSCFNFLSIEELRLWYWQAKPTVEALMQKHDKNDGLGKSDDHTQYVKALDRLDITELPFQSYASEHVFVHAQHAELNKITQTHFVDLFGKHHGEVFKTWALFHDKMKAESHDFLFLQGPRAAFMYTVSCYNLPSCAEYLLQSGVDPNHDCGSGWRFPLIRAAELGFLEVVRLLLDHKADIEARGMDETTALHVASSGGQVEIVRLLLARGANIETSDPSGRTALYIAWQHNQRSAGQNEDVTKQSHHETVQLLLMCGADIKAKDVDGNTLLHMAAESNSEAIVQLLLMRGLAVDAQNEKHETALHVAAFRGNEAVAQLLLDNKANAKIQNKEGETALRRAVEWNYGPMIQLLLAQETSIDIQDQEGRTALHIAARHCKEAVIRLLLDHGANIEVQTYEGCTALHLAAGYGHEAVIRLLLDHRANIEIMDHEGRTALQWVIEKRWRRMNHQRGYWEEKVQMYDEVIELLKSHAEELKIPLSSLLHPLDPDNPGDSDSDDNIW